MDLNALATKFGGTVTPVASSPVNLSSLAQKFGGVTSTATAPAAPKQYNLLEKVAMGTNKVINSIGSVLTSSERKVGEIAGQSAAVNSQDFTDLQKSTQGLSDIQLKTQKIINEKKARGEDTSKLEETLNKTQGKQNIDINEIAPASQATNVEALGALGGTALDVLSAGALSSGTKSFSLATKIPAAEKAVQGLTLAQKLLGIGKATAKTAAYGAALGYGYDVTQKAQQNQVDFKPGLGTFVGGAIPLGIGGVQAGMAIAKEQAPRIINSLITPKIKDFSYGKNPGRAISEEGIVANSLDDLGTKVNQSRQKVGQTIGDLTNNLEGKVQLNLKGSFAPLDNAMNDAAKQGNQTLLDRLYKTKQALTNTLIRDVNLPEEAVKSFVDNAAIQVEGRGDTALANGIRNLDTSGIKTVSDLVTEIKNNLGDEALNNPDVQNWVKSVANLTGEVKPGAVTNNIISIGEKNLTDSSFKEALKMKGTVGDITQWTGNPSDDKLVNNALKQVYGSIKGSMNSAAESVDPTIASQLKKMNERYADLTSADIAIKYRDILNQRKNIISMPIKMGGTAGLITSVATGGAAIPAVLAATTVGLLDKAAESAAFKTRLAAWLGKASPEVLAGIVKQNPEVGSSLLKMFTKEYTPIESSVERYKSIPNKQGGFVRIGAREFKEIDEATKKEMIQLIDYIRIGKEVNNSMENSLSKIQDKYNINPDWSSTKIADTLEKLIENTKTR